LDSVNSGDSVAAISAVAGTLILPASEIVSVAESPSGESNFHNVNECSLTSTQASSFVLPQRNMNRDRLNPSAKEFCPST